MHRCASLCTLLSRRSLALSLAGLLLSAGAAHAQVQRVFPATALRGEISFGEPPEVWMNRQPAQLAPGVRIRGTDNMVLMSGALIGQRLVVNYTLDTLGLIKDVWVLREEEARRLPWPRTPQEAATWAFDPSAQVWVKP